MNAVRFCLNFENIKLEDIQYITFYEKPFLKFERLLETYLSFAPRGLRSFLKSMPIWLSKKIFQKKMIKDKLNLIGDTSNIKFLFSDHHSSHAASAFFPSPFQKALILTADGVGEWATTSVFLGDGNKMSLEKEIHFPHSIGLLYSAFTYYLGFKVNSDEYKVMGLAPYGRPIYTNLILEHLVDLKRDGSYRLNMDYFDFCTGLRMTSKKFNNLFNEPPRKSNSIITQKHKDIACSIQKITEVMMMRIVKELVNEFGIKNLCLAGGVALNCVANGKILRESGIEDIWIQPAAGDAGGAIGAALITWHQYLENKRCKDKDSMKGALLGPNFSRNEIIDFLSKEGVGYKELDEDDLCEFVAEQIDNGKVIGWFQGRMEFGPRALGARSILADPRNKSMQGYINNVLKRRESFRPFAPSILEEDLEKYYELSKKSPYMLLVAQILEKHQFEKHTNIPAVTHIDYTSRIQTVSKSTNKKYWKLISCFKKRTGVPILLNTSFNVRGEPIVCNIRDAFECYKNAQLDILVLENFIIQ